MKKRQLLLVLLLMLGIILVACGGDDEEAKDTFKIGVLTYTPAHDGVYEGFKDGMVELGYAEDDSANIKVEYIYEIRDNTQPALIAGATKLIDDAQVDLILSLGTPSTLAAKTATEGKDTPVVFVPVNDPVESGIVESINNPGGNMTGIRVRGFISKGLEWLHKIVPDVKVVFAPYNPDGSSSTIAYNDLVSTAAELGVEIITTEVTTPEEVIAAFQDIPDEAEAVFIVADAMIGNQIGELVPAAIERGIPTVGYSSEQVVAGVLMGYGFESDSMGKQVARLAVEILSGTNPGDLPIETAEFYLSINLITAEASGIEITDEILSLVNGVIVRE